MMHKAKSVTVDSYLFRDITSCFAYNKSREYKISNAKFFVIVSFGLHLFEK